MSSDEGYMLRLEAHKINARVASCRFPQARRPRTPRRGAGIPQTPTRLRRVGVAPTDTTTHGG